MSKRAVDHLLDSLSRDCSRLRRVVAILSSETIHLIRKKFQDWSPSDLLKRLQSENPEDRVHNKQIVHHSGWNPDSVPGTADRRCFQGAVRSVVRNIPIIGKAVRVLEPKLRWVRSVLPWDLDRTDPAWHHFKRSPSGKAELE